MLRPLLATGPEHRHSSVRAKFGVSYVSSTSGGASRYNSQESRSSDPDVGVAKAARLNSQESMESSNKESTAVSWKDDKGDELVNTARKE